MSQKRNFVDDPRCLNCGHRASEHGHNGSRPCLAVVGELGRRQFCACDELKLKAALAA